MATALLALIVIGGYMALTPMLSSLVASPAWPEPLADAGATGVVLADSTAASANVAAPAASTPKPRLAKAKPKASKPKVVYIVRYVPRPSTAQRVSRPAPAAASRRAPTPPAPRRSTPKRPTPAATPAAPQEQVIVPIGGSLAAGDDEPDADPITSGSGGG